MTRDARTILALAALLLGALFVPPTAVSDGETFTVPPLRIGDRASYDGPGNLDLVILPPEEIVTADGRTLEAIPLRFDHRTSEEDPTHYLNPATARIERNDAPCLVQTAAGCERWIARDWYIHGTPGILGASILQGRTFQIGDEWNLSGACEACASAIHVRIDPPNARSPSGTAFVANLSGTYRHARIHAWEAPRGDLHMGRDHAFPLLAELQPDFAWMGPRTFSLIAYHSGGTAITLGTADPVLLPPLTSLPFLHGYPVEGEPLPGWPSWEEARAFAGTAMGPDETFLRVDVSVQENIAVRPPGFGRTDLYARYSIREREARANAADGTTTYETERIAVISGEWTATNGTAAASTPAICEKVAAPLWDGARLGLSHPDLLSDLTRLTYKADCRDDSLTLYGAFHLQQDGLQLAESVILDAKTGTLRWAFDWPA